MTFCRSLGGVCTSTANSEYPYNFNGDTMSRRENYKCWLLVCVCLATAHAGFGQATTGTISGTVYDVQKARVAGPL